MIFSPIGGVAGDDDGDQCNGLAVPDTMGSIGCDAPVADVALRQGFHTSCTRTVIFLTRA